MSKPSNGEEAVGPSEDPSQGGFPGSHGVGSPFCLVALESLSIYPCRDGMWFCCLSWHLPLEIVLDSSSVLAWILLISGSHWTLIP